MKFRTEVEIKDSEIRIDHQSKIMMLGSCFTQNIGQVMQQNKFSVNLNPFGVIYNPASISQSIQLLIDNKQFSEENLIFRNGLYSSFYHHSSFSDQYPRFCLDKINESQQKACQDLRRMDILLITFGTSYVYELIEDNRIVSNCHKLPASQFRRSKLTVDSIVGDWNKLLAQLLELNPRLKVIFTVSPIRHLGDGAHENQLSKATLLLSIDRLVQEHKEVSYFPSYEIVLDDLRDYRFYEEDMTHPNGLAIKYIWEKFEYLYFDTNTKEIIKEWYKIYSAIQHRPLNGETEEYKHFLKQTLLRLYSFNKKYPYICSEEEIDDLSSRIDNLI